MPIVAVAIAGAWLACMPACDSGCEGTQSSREYRNRESRRALVDEFCAPGTYFMECVWRRQDLCYAEMPMFAAVCVEPEQRPGETYREAVLNCMLHRHFFDLVQQDVIRPECLDPAPWEHVLPTSASMLETILYSWKRYHRARTIPDVEESRPDNEADNETDNETDNGPDNCGERKSPGR